MDKMQETLIKKGRTDLAAEYQKKIAADTGNELHNKVKVERLLMDSIKKLKTISKDKKQSNSSQIGYYQIATAIEKFLPIEKFLSKK